MTFKGNTMLFYCYEFKCRNNSHVTVVTFLFESSIFILMTEKMYTYILYVCIWWGSYMKIYKNNNNISNNNNNNNVIIEAVIK